MHTIVLEYIHQVLLEYYSSREGRDADPYYSSNISWIILSSTKYYY